MGYTDRRVRRVDRLAAGTGRAVHVDLEVLLGYLEVYVLVLEQRDDVHRCERRVPPLVRVERGDPHQAMHAVLRGKHAVRETPVNDERRAFDAGLVAFLPLDDVDLERVSLRPAQVHAEQHLGPVLRFRSTRAGVQRDDRIALVVFTGEQRPDLQVFDSRTQGSDAVLYLGFDAR